MSDEEVRKTREQIQAKMKEARSDQPLVTSEEFAAQMEAMIGSSGMKKSPKKSQPSKSGQKSTL